MSLRDHWMPPVFPEFGAVGPEQSARGVVEGGAFLMAANIKHSTLRRGEQRDVPYKNSP
jgi:hypothetical protein